MTKQMLAAYACGLIGLSVAFFSAAPAAAQDGRFVAVEVQGMKFWLGGGDVDLKAPRESKQLVFKVTNKLDGDHGFAIDALKVKQVVKAGEDTMITVPVADLDPAVMVLKYYCHLHPGHVGGTLVLVR